MNKVKHGKYGKAEPKPHAKSPAAVNQLGAHVGDHIMEKRGSTGYRGEEMDRGKGYTPPVGPTDNVKAVGVGGGRTIYACGTVGVHGPTNPGQPMKPAKPLWPGWEK
jgi:hypothetical protein